MATAPNQLEGIAQLASLLGGNKTTTNAGNTDPLQQVLAQLQGTDYNAMLQSIFQQAGGAIPGLQAAYGNAIGARSGGNSAVQAALNKLMSQTTLAGQQQLATQQNQNMQTQGQAAANIAQATKGTETKAGTDMSQVAKSLAIMKLLSETGAFKAMGLGTQDAPAAAVSSAPAVAPVNLATPDYGLSSAMTSTSAPASLESAFAPNMFNFNPVGDSGAAAPVDNSAMYDISTGGSAPSFGSNFSTPDFTDYTTYTPPDYSVTPDYSLPTAGYEPGFSVDPSEWDIGFADGGMVKKNANDYADGGLVTQQARGGRRSSAAEVQTTAPKTTMASNTGGLNTLDIGALMAPSSVGEVESARTALTSPTSMGTLQGVGGSGNGNLSFRGTDNNINPSTLNAINQANRINSLSGLTGGPSVPGLGGIMGLVNAKSPEQALTAAGTTALGMASPQLASIARFAMDPTQVKAIDIATSMVPGLNVANLALGLAGTSVGQLSLGAPQAVDPKTGEVREASMGVFGGGGQFGGDPARSSPVSGFGDVATTDLSYVGTPATSPFSPSLNDVAPTSSVSSGGWSSAGNQGNGVTTSPVSGWKGVTTTNLGPAGGGGNYGSVGGNTSDTAGNSNQGAGAATGGHIDGPGTGTSDDIQLNVSDGETIVTAQTTAAMREMFGENIFHEFEKAFNPKAAAAQVKLGRI